MGAGLSGPGPSAPAGDPRYWPQVLFKSLGWGRATGILCMLLALKGEISGLPGMVPGSRPGCFMLQLLLWPLPPEDRCWLHILGVSFSSLPGPGLGFLHTYY